MSRISFSMMEAGFIPGDIGAFKKEGGKIKLYDEGGQSTPSEQMTRTLGYSGEYEPYIKENIKRAMYETSKPYEKYQGQRFAGFDPMQLMAQQNAANLGPAQQLGTATQMAGLAGLRAGQLSYDPAKFAYDKTTAPSLTQYQMKGPSNVSTGAFTDQGTAETYMSPYMQNVVDIQKREAKRQADIARGQRNVQAAASGAFGGSRAAMIEAAANRDIAQQMGDIQAKGSQAAYEQAAAQFQQDQARALQAQQANQQAGLTAGQANLQALLGIQQLGAGNEMQAALANQQAGLEAQRMQEQSRQYGAGLGLQGLQAQLAAAGQLGQLGATQFGQEKDVISALSGAGAERRGLEQQRLTRDYEDWMAQRQHPYQQIAYMMEMMKGAPQQTTSSIYAAPQSLYSQIAGAANMYAGGRMAGAWANGGLTGLALYNMTK